MTVLLELMNLWPSVCTSYPPLPPSMLRFTGIQSYSYTEQRKVETDFDQMAVIELATLQLRRPHTNQLSYVCSLSLIFIRDGVYQMGLDVPLNRKLV